MRTVEHARANCSVADGRALSPALLTRLEAHAWPRNFYPKPRGARRVVLSAIAGVLLLALWVVLGFVIPLGAGCEQQMHPAGAQRDHETQHHPQCE